MSIDQAATFAPVTVPLRDEMRTDPAMVANVGTDSAGREMVYAGGIPTEAYQADGKTLRGVVVVLAATGGLDGGTAYDRPFIRFSVYSSSAAEAEAAAYGLREWLAHLKPGLLLGSSQVRLAGAESEPPIWAPDPDTRTPRYVVTATLTVQAVGT